MGTCGEGNYIVFLYFGIHGIVKRLVGVFTRELSVLLLLLILHM